MLLPVSLARGPSPDKRAVLRCLRATDAGRWVRAFLVVVVVVVVVIVVVVVDIVIDRLRSITS
jgi:hypothetical protein